MPIVDKAVWRLVAAKTRFSATAYGGDEGWVVDAMTNDAYGNERALCVLYVFPHEHGEYVAHLRAGINDLLRNGRRFDPRISYSKEHADARR